MITNVPRILLSTLYKLAFIFQQLLEVDTLTFQVWKWRPRECIDLCKVMQQVMEVVSDQGSLSTESVLLTVTFCLCSLRD